MLTIVCVGLALGVVWEWGETHRANVMAKLDLNSVPELTKYALREGLTTL